MNLLAAWKKVLLFGLFGAAGCLAGWPVGELVLWLGLPSDQDAGRAPSLVTGPVVPKVEIPAAAAPPPSREFLDRLQSERAKTGDVQISLIWFDTNDLDLHCVGPDVPRYEIFYSTKNRPSPSGGELDVDANASCHRVTPTPVENIYWPTGGAPAGVYEVYVNFFQRCPNAPDASKYKLTVLHDGQRPPPIEGTISPREGKRLVYRFELRPRLEVFAPAAAEVVAGTAVKIPFAVRRSYARGPVTVRLDGLPAGLSAAAVTVPADRTEGELDLKVDATARADKASPRVVATLDSLTQSAAVDLAVSSPPGGAPPPTPPFSWWGVVLIGVWTAVIAAGLTLALLGGQNHYLGKPLLDGGKSVAIVAGGAAAGFVSGSVGNTLFQLLYSANLSGLGFAIGWALLGGLLGWGISFFLPNLDAKKAAAAGLAGGLLGAAAFFAGRAAAEWGGRVLGASILGFCIGLMVAVVEAAFRRAWLEVRHGTRELITINLGPEPVRVGGDSRQCAVWARGAAPVALKYWLRDGKVVCEDAVTRQTADVRDGDHRTVGGVGLTVRTGAAGGEAAPAPAPLPAAPAASPPPAAARPAAGPPPVASLDDDFAPVAAPRPAPAPPPKPAAPPPPKPTTAAAPPAPPRPAAPATPTRSAPAAPAKPAADGDGCPSCGRKTPGRHGARYCVMCDRTY